MVHKLQQFSWYRRNHAVFLNTLYFRTIEDNVLDFKSLSTNQNALENLVWLWRWPNFFALKSFLTKIFGTTIFSDQKSFWTKIFLDPIFFLTQTLFGPRIILDSIFFSRLDIFFRPKFFLTKSFHPKSFMTQNSSWPKIFSAPNFFGQNFFLTQFFLDPIFFCTVNIFGPQDFLDP